LCPGAAEFLDQGNVNVLSVIVAVIFYLMKMCAMQMSGTFVGFNMQMQSTHLHGEQTDAGKGSK